MLAGDPFLRSYNPSIDDSRSITFRCLDANDASGTGPDTNGLPTTPCRGGIRSQINFPTCWDGKNLDSPDHQSHMNNTAGEGFSVAKPCPESHPVRMPQVAYETLWDTSVFAGMWPEDGSQPFVWSYDDSKGYGTHADYMFGWKDDALQRAMDKPECFYDGCGSITKQAMSVANQCTVKDMVGEETDGCKISRRPDLRDVIANLN